MDLLTAAGRRGKGAERSRGKRALRKRIENFVEFTTVALKRMLCFQFSLLTFGEEWMN